MSNEWYVSNEIALSHDDGNKCVRMSVNSGDYEEQPTEIYLVRDEVEALINALKLVMARIDQVLQ